MLASALGSVKPDRKDISVLGCTDGPKGATTAILGADRWHDAGRRQRNRNQNQDADYATIYIPNYRDVHRQYEVSLRLRDGRHATGDRPDRTFTAY